MTPHTDDPRKYSLATPSTIARGILKICENSTGAPNSERVVQDVYLAFDAKKIVYEAYRKMVPGLVDRNGDRYNKDGII